MAAIDRPKTLTEQAYRRLKLALRNGLLVRKRFYPLGQIASQLGISRTPVREAVLQLSHEGLVEIVPQRGFRLRQISAEEAAEVFALRGLIEGWAVSKLARRGSPHEVQELRAILDRQAAVVADVAAFLEIDEQFHQRMIEFAKSPRARYFLISLRDTIWLLGSEAVSRPGRTVKVLAEHTRIVDAIANRDPAGARRALNAHLNSTYRKIKQAIGERQLRDARGGR